jgi:hypothetical protein
MQLWANESSIRNFEFGDGTIYSCSLVYPTLLDLPLAQQLSSTTPSAFTNISFSHSVPTVIRMHPSQP